TITVSGAAATATAIGITTQPSTMAQSGIAFAAQPVVRVQDAAGNAVSQSGVTITVAKATGSGTLGGTLTASTNASGVATFTGLSITGSGAHTLTFSATGLTSATSGTITVSDVPPVASQIAVNDGNFQSATKGTAVATAPSVIVKDQ